MAKYKIIAADTEQFKSLFSDYKKIMRVVTVPHNNTLAELEDTEDFLTIINGAKAPEYLKN